MRSGLRRSTNVVRTAYSNITEDYTFQAKKLQFINLHPNALNNSCIFRHRKRRLTTKVDGVKKQVRKTVLDMQQTKH